MNTSPIRFYELADLTFLERNALLQRIEYDLTEFIDQVKPIIDEVRTKGDAALIHYAAKFDKATLTTDSLRVSDTDFEMAYNALNEDVDAALDYAIENIHQFHQAQMPCEMWLKEIRSGVLAGERVVPIPSVACYVPRGQGGFPSVAMMTTIPALIAKVPRIIVLTPPRADGKIDDATLVACAKIGVTEVYKVGGAQAVAAVGFGTPTVPKVAKLVGAGNPWLMAAKRVLIDHLEPGPPAGPSEAIVLADSTADPRLVGLDLIIESEHGADSSVFLVTDSRAMAQEVAHSIPDYWKQMGKQRAEFSRIVLCGSRGGIILASDLDAGIDFINDYAPEHLMIHSLCPFDYLGKIQNAGEILLGDNTPMTLANFVIGPNCVLPTGSKARTWSPLSVHDFLKRLSIASVTASSAYHELATHASSLARYEGFDGHALAVSPLRDTIRSTK